MTELNSACLWEQTVLWPNKLGTVSTGSGNVGLMFAYLYEPEITI